MYYYDTCVLPNLGTFYFCVLHITYARHVEKMASLRSAEYAKLEAVAYEESDIWTNLLHSFTFYSSKVDGVGLPYAMV